MHFNLLRSLNGQIEEETEKRKTFHLLIYTISNHNGWCWARLNPKPWEISWVPHINVRDPGVWAILLIFPRSVVICCEMLVLHSVIEHTVPHCHPYHLYFKDLLRLKNEVAWHNFLVLDWLEMRCHWCRIYTPDSQATTPVIPRSSSVQGEQELCILMGTCVCVL